MSQGIGGFGRCRLPPFGNPTSSIGSPDLEAVADRHSASRDTAQAAAKNPVCANAAGIVLIKTFGSKPS